MMPTEKIAVTQQIKKLLVDARNQLNITAAELSDQIKGSSYWLSNIENGRTKNILHDDLIRILMLAYKCSEEDAQNRLSGAITLINNIPTTNTHADDTEELLIYKGNDEIKLDDIAKYQKEFEIAREDIMNGFNIFFNKVNDKKDVVDLMKDIQRNFHCDLGFMLSVLSLPWCKIAIQDVEAKRAFVRNLFSSLSEIQKCSDCPKKKSKVDNCSDTDSEKQ